MFTCPNCESKLKKIAAEAGIFWSCPVCNGRAVNLPVLQKVIPDRIVHKLWLEARSNDDGGDKPCPACGRKMKIVPLQGADSRLYLDVCITCQFIWFDPKEFEKVPPAHTSRSLTERKPSPVSQMTMARAELMLIRQEHEAELLQMRTPDHWWEIFPALFGLPVEYDNRGVVDKPFATWMLSACMVLIYLITMSDLNSAIENWGLIPAELYRRFGATLITSFFLHGGLFHLLSNLYFLLVFGDNVEDAIGWRKYLLLIASGALLGDAIHMLSDLGSFTPLIGASAGISAIIVYYALQFPKNRAGLLLFFHWYRLPVGVMIVFWLLVQLLGVIKQIAGFSSVSALAHVGGAVAGLLFWLYSKQSYSGTSTMRGLSRNI